MFDNARSGGLRISVHSSFSDACPAWRRFEEDGVCYAFQSYQWMSCWYRCIGRTLGITPCLVAVEDAEAGPLLFLPMGIERTHGVSRLVWLGGRATDYHAPILGSGLEAFCRTIPFDVLWARIRTHLPSFDVIHFEKQPERIERQANPFAGLSMLPNPRSAHSAALPGVWDDLYRQKCSTKTRRGDRYYENRMSKTGLVAFSMPHDHFEADMAVSRMIELKRLRYRRTGVSDPLRSPAVQDFYRSLSDAGPGDLRVHISFIEVGGDIAAVHWGVTYRGRFHHLMPAFDEDRFGEMRPGSQLTRKLLEWACGNELRVFDFGLGDEPYKDRWCDTTLPLWDHLDPVTLGGRAYVAQVSAMRSVKRILANSPALSRVVPIIKRAMHMHADK